MNILVTGANGQLGQALRFAVGEGSLASANLPTPTELPSKCDSLSQARTNELDYYCFTDVAELDITDYEAIERYMSEQKIDLIVNCASYTAVERAEDEEAVAEKVNSTAVRYLALAAKAHDALLIHISTDYVFDGSQSAPINESQATAPLNAYARTKLHGEQAIEEVGCKYIILRTAWMYSQYARNFFLTIYDLTARKTEIKVIDDQIGSPTYAPDLASVIVRIISERKFFYGLYHYSGDCAISWCTFASAIAELSGHNGCNVIPCSTSDYPTKAQRPLYSVLDKTKFVQSFGIALPDWRQSLKNCIDSL